MTLLPLLIGCIFITGDEARERYDGDADGVDVFTDCDDADPARALPMDWYADNDGDGYGAGAPVSACEAPSQYVADGADCDDSDAGINPGASEVCDGIDNDCDTVADDGVGDAQTWYADSDGDGYGDPDDSALACEQPDGAVSDSSDCDDDDAGVNPGSQEICDGVDNDCDGAADDADDDAADPLEWSPDGDGDGYGELNSEPVVLCFPPSGYAAPGDCDDGEPDVNPGEEEVCGDGLDNDCDGAACRYAGAYVLGEADVILDGPDYNGAAGTAIAAGDLTGDGDPDLLIGAPGGSDYGSNGYPSGRAYAVEGPLYSSGTLGGGLGFALSYGSGTGGRLGLAVAVADLTGDGQDDAIVSLPTLDQGLDVWAAGGITIAAGPLSAATDLSRTATLLQGGGYEENAGAALFAGDLDGDGDADLAAGAPNLNVGVAAGGVWLVEGPVPGASAPLSDGHRIAGEGDNDRAGFALDGGDLDGDGYTDLAVGAPYVDGSRGAVYLVSGPFSTDSSLSTAPRISADQNGTYLGLAVAAVGDVDGDGQDDLLLGAPNVSASGANSGAAYLFYGPVEGNLSLGDADVELAGEVAGGYAGAGVSGAGDVDGDGRDDLLILAAYAAGGDGRVYLQHGGLDGDAVDLGAADADFSAGVDVYSEGRSLAPVGDMDGDGYADFIVGSPKDSGASSYAGAAYLFYGGRYL